MRRWLILVMALWIAPPAFAAPCAGFADVDDANSFCANVAWITNRNVTLGCATNLYCPTDLVNRLAMAAFLNRLGDVLVPPSIVWVAPTGGMFRSIQQAIDYAAALQPPGRRLVKVAPGVYNEAITLAPGVDVEGSGVEATTITSSLCTAGAPQAGTVTITHSFVQLRHVTVNHAGTAASGPECAGVYLGNALGTLLSDVRVINGSAQNKLYGIRMLLPNASGPAATLERVTVDVIGTGFVSAVGIEAAGTAAATMALREVAVHVNQNLGNSTSGIELNSANATLERVVVSTSGLGPSPARSALLVSGAASSVLVQNSSLQASGGLYVTNAAGASSVRIASSLLEGGSSGVVTCFNNYDASLAPVVC